MGCLKTFIMGEDVYSLRHLQESDIPHLIEYWFGEEQKQLHAMCKVDFEKLGTPEEMQNRLLDRIATKQKSFKESGALSLIVEKNNVPISNIIAVKQSSESLTRVHCNIWKEYNRNRGIGSALFLNALETIFDQTNLTSVVFETSTQNLAINRLVQKFGLKPLYTEIGLPSPIAFIQEIHHYEITKEQLHELVGLK